MYKPMIRIVFIFIFLFAFYAVPHMSWAIEDGIVAIVNDDIVTIKDLRDYLNAKILQLRLEGKSPEEIEKNISELEINGIQRLIEERLIIDKANLLGIVVRDEAINNKYQTIRDRYESEEEFLDALLSDGATITDLKNKITNQLKIQFLVDEEVSSKIYITPKEVTDYYAKNKARFLKPAKVRLDSIYISYRDDIEKARTKANEALAQIAAGKDFSTVSKKYSEGPDIGTLEKGQLLPSVEETVFKLNVGGISSLIEVETGFFIFRIKEKIPAQTASLEEVKGRIEGMIHSRKFQNKLQNWLEELKREAFIELK